MITGNIKRIDLGQSSFENLINDNNLYIDKSRFIENFLNESNSVQLTTVTNTKLLRHMKPLCYQPDLRETDF